MNHGRVFYRRRGTSARRAPLIKGCSSFPRSPPLNLPLPSRPDRRKGTAVRARTHSAVRAAPYAGSMGRIIIYLRSSLSGWALAGMGEARLRNATSIHVGGERLQANATTVLTISVATRSGKRSVSRGIFLQQRMPIRQRSWYNRHPMRILPTVSVPFDAFTMIGRGRGRGRRYASPRSSVCPLAPIRAC